MDTWLITVTLLLGVVGLFYVFLMWNYGKWTKRGITEAKSYPVAGSLPSAYTQKRHMIYDINDIYKQYKNTDKFVGIFNSRSPQLFIMDPDLVHKIYVNDFKSFHDNEFAEFVDEKSDLILANNPFVLKGDKWKERRLEVVPGMTPNRIKNAYPVTLDVCKRLTAYIKEQNKKAGNDGLNTGELCLRYTSEVVTDCILGIQSESLTNKPTPILDNMKELFNNSFWFLLYQLMAGLIPGLRHFYKMSLFSDKSTKFFFNLMSQSIEVRRQQSNAGERMDFLNYLLQLQDKKSLSTNVMVSHVMTFLTDGFATTAHTVNHCFLGLARNQEAQQKLREEIEENLNSEGVLPFEKLSELPYLDACIHESLRLFPALLFVTKQCTEPYEFVNTNGQRLKLKPDEVVLMSPYSLHHDENYYKDAESFKPERFLPENGGVKKYRDEGKYLGFGDGPRICLGMRFALTQGKAALVEIIRNFNIKVNPKSRSDNLLDKKEFIAGLDGGVWLDFEPRK